MTEEHITKAEFMQFEARFDDRFDRVETAMSKHRDDHLRADEREQEAHGVIHTRIDAMKERLAAHEQATAVAIEQGKGNHNLLALKVGLLIAGLLMFKDAIFAFLTKH